MERSLKCDAGEGTAAANGRADHQRREADGASVRAVNAGAHGGQVSSAQARLARLRDGACWVVLFTVAAFGLRVLWLDHCRLGELYRGSVPAVVTVQAAGR